MLLPNKKNVNVNKNASKISVQCLSLATRGYHCTMLHIQSSSAERKPHLHAFNTQYLSGKVTAELELLEEGRHDDSREEENDTPEEDIRNVGTMRAAGAAHKFSLVFNTVLQQERGQ